MGLQRIGVAVRVVSSVDGSGAVVDHIVPASRRSVAVARDDAANAHLWMKQGAKWNGRHGGVKQLKDALLTRGQAADHRYGDGNNELRSRRLGLNEFRGVHLHGSARSTRSSIGGASRVIIVRCVLSGAVVHVATIHSIGGVAASISVTIYANYDGSFWYEPDPFMSIKRDSFRERKKRM